MSLAIQGSSIINYRPLPSQHDKAARFTARSWHRFKGVPPQEACNRRNQLEHHSTGLQRAAASETIPAAHHGFAVPPVLLPVGTMQQHVVLDGPGSSASSSTLQDSDRVGPGHCMRHSGSASSHDSSISCISSNSSGCSEHQSPASTTKRQLDSHSGSGSGGGSGLPASLTAARQQLSQPTSNLPTTR
jgi:hypothetical protein